MRNKRISDAIRAEMLAINSRYIGTTEAATGYLDGLGAALAIVGEEDVPAEEVSGGSGHGEWCGHGDFPPGGCPECGPSCSRWCCQ